MKNNEQVLISFGFFGSSLSILERNKSCPASRKGRPLSVSCIHILIAIHLHKTHRAINTTTQNSQKLRQCTVGQSAVYFHPPLAKPALSAEYEANKPGIRGGQMTLVVDGGIFLKRSVNVASVKFCFCLSLDGGAEKFGKWQEDF